jgi:hypothetical protein
VGEGHLARMRRCSAADKPGHRDRVVRRPKRPPIHQLAVARQEPRDRPDGGRFDHLVLRERRKNRGQPAGEHCLSAAWRPDQEQVVGAARRDLERALGVRLAANVGEIQVVRRRRRGCVWRGRRSREHLAVEKAHGITQCVRGEHLETADGPRLGVVGEGHDQGGDPVSPTRQPDGECSAHSLDLTVERKLADDREWTDALAGHGAGGGENPKGDR